MPPSSLEWDYIKNTRYTVGLRKISVILHRAVKNKKKSALNYDCMICTLSTGTASLTEDGKGRTSEGATTVYYTAKYAGISS